MHDVTPIPDLDNASPMPFQAWLASEPVNPEVAPTAIIPAGLLPSRCVALVDGVFVCDAEPPADLQRRVDEKNGDDEERARSLYRLQIADVAQTSPMDPTYPRRQELLGAALRSLNRIAARKAAAAAPVEPLSSLRSKPGRPASARRAARAPRARRVAVRRVDRDDGDDDPAPARPEPAPRDVDVEAIVGAVERSPELGARLARALAPYVLAFLGAAVARTTAPTTYSSRRGHEPPEYRERTKRWRQDIEGIPGAFQQGRWWVIRVEDYEAWVRRTSKSGERTAADIDKPAEVEKPWTPRRALDRAGLRGAR